MNKDIAKLHSSFSVDDDSIVQEDTRFLKVTIDVLHDGLNRNGSFFTKEVVDECIDTIKGVPILGYIRYDALIEDNDFKGHEHIIKKTKDGIEEVYIGQAYGFVPDGCNPRWVEKVCSDGATRNFLCVSGILWEKFSDATSIVKRDVEKPQSMELSMDSVEGYEDEDGVFHFTKFSFDGLCMLGDGVTPAMVDANVRIEDDSDNSVNFSVNNFKDEIRKELSDKLEKFNAIFTELIKDDVKEEQGGVRDMPKNMVDAVEVEQSDVEFEQTTLETVDDMAGIIASHEMVQCPWGEHPRFHFVDIQGNEVIVVDTEEQWHYYGFPFVIDGDKLEVDFENGKRKKLRYEDYEDGVAPVAGSFELGEHISEIEAKFAEESDDSSKKISELEAKVEELEKKVEELESQVEERDEKISELEEQVKKLEDEKSGADEEFAKVKAEYDEIKPKYDEYVQAEAQRIEAELVAQKDAVFAEYESDLADNTEFAALKEKKDEMTAEDIEKECAFLYVKANRAKSKFSAVESQSAVVGVLNDVDSHEDDGLVLTKYGYIHTSR